MYTNLPYSVNGDVPKCPFSPIARLYCHSALCARCTYAPSLYIIINDSTSTAPLGCDETICSIGYQDVYMCTHHGLLSSLHKSIHNDSSTILWCIPVNTVIYYLYTSGKSLKSSMLWYCQCSPQHTKGISTQHPFSRQIPLMWVWVESERLSSSCKLRPSYTFLLEENPDCCGTILQCPSSVYIRS